MVLLEEREIEAELQREHLDHLLFQHTEELEREQRRREARSNIPRSRTRMKKLSMDEHEKNNKESQGHSKSDGYGIAQHAGHRNAVPSSSEQLPSAPLLMEGCKPPTKPRPSNRATRPHRRGQYSEFTIPLAPMTDSPSPPRPKFEQEQEQEQEQKQEQEQELQGDKRVVEVASFPLLDALHPTSVGAEQIKPHGPTLGAVSIEMEVPLSPVSPPQPRKGYV